MKKTVISILMIMFLLTSCNDYKEFEDLTLVFGIGIDYDIENDTIHTTIDQTSRSPSPTGGTSGEKDLELLHINTASGETFETSLNTLQTTINREIYMPFTKCIIIGKDLATENFEEILSYFELTTDIRTTAYLIIAENTAYEIYAYHDPSEYIVTSDVIEKLLINNSETTGTIPVKLGEAYKMIYYEGMELTLPAIKVDKTIDIEKESEKDTTKEGEESNQESTKQENDSLEIELPTEKGYVKQSTGEHIISGYAVFKDEKLLGFLDEPDSQSLTLIKGSKIQKYILGSCLYQNQNIDFSYNLNQNSSAIKAYMVNGEPSIDLKIEMNGTIGNINNADDLFNDELITIIENEIEDIIKKQIENTIMHVQDEYNSDIFGFGYQFFIDEHEAWQNLKLDWDNYFQDLPINVEVIVKIDNTGRKLRFNSLKQ